MLSWTATREVLTVAEGCNNWQISGQSNEVFSPLERTLLELICGELIWRGADLCGADLCGADLCGADLRGADLW